MDRPTPNPPPGWVLVGVGAVGICGTDLRAYRGTVAPTTGLVPGHEIGGVLLDATSKALTTGTAVAVEPLLTCGTCRQCRSGSDNRCRMRTLLGVTGGDGGLAEVVAVPQPRTHPLPAGMTAVDGALVEPLAVCVRAVRRAGVGLGDTVAILGAGTIGLLSAIATRAAGASRVVVVGRYAHQRQRAEALGAQGVAGASAAAAELGEGADVVIETVGGHAATLAEAVELVRPGGVVGVLGVFDGHAQVPGLAFSRKEARLVASNCYGGVGAQRDFAVAVGLLVRHLEQVRSIVTHRFPLQDVETAFAVAADRAAGSIKVLVLP